MTISREQARNNALLSLVPWSQVWFGLFRPIWKETCNANKWLETPNESLLYPPALCASFPGSGSQKHNARAWLRAPKYIASALSTWYPMSRIKPPGQPSE